MKVNLKTEIKGLKGEIVRMSFPPKILADTTRNNPEKLPPETVSNVLLNVIATYPVRDRKEIFMINEIASKILSVDGEKVAEVEFNDKEIALLNTVLLDQTFQVDEKGEKKGVYLSNTISQVYKALGINE